MGFRIFASFPLKEGSCPENVRLCSSFLATRLEGEQSGLLMDVQTQTSLNRGGSHCFRKGLQMVSFPIF